MIPLVPHYVTLSPLESPITYIFFVLTWLSCLFCIWVSFYFYRTKKESWWLLIAAAFVFPLVAEISMCLLHGLPPLPYSLVYPPQKLPPSGPENYQQPGVTGTLTTISTSVSRVQWSLYPPMMALALGWAYLAERKKQAALTAQT
jgi:hypothetical protein